MFVEKIFRILVAFLVGIVLARYLGPDEYGLFNYAISFAGLFTSFANLGMDSIVVRELVKSPNRKDEILGTVFRLRIFGSLVAITLATLTAYLINEPSYNLTLIVIIASSTIFQSSGVIEQFFQSRVEAKYNVYAQSFSFFISAALKILLVLLNKPLIFLALAHAIEYVFLFIGYLYVYKNTKSSLKTWRYDRKTAIEFLKDSWPLLLSGVVISIYMKIDQVMIKSFLTYKDLGYYAVAVKLCEAWYFVPVVISTSVFPAIVNAKNSNQQIYFSRIQKLYDFLASISIGIAIPVTIFSNLIIEILFGNSYQPASSVLTIYIWAGVATFLGVASNQYLITENLTKLSFYRTLLGMIINVLMNLFLIPAYGINGAAFATLISYSVTVFSIYFDKRAREQFYMMLKSIMLVNILKLIKGTLRNEIH